MLSSLVPEAPNLNHALIDTVFSLLYMRFLKILLLGGTGKDGKRKLIGWLSKASICLWHLRGKRPFGRKFSRFFYVNFSKFSFWV